MTRHVMINPNKLIHINEEDVISLVSNTLIVVSHKKYKIRITKELIPGLKKNFMLSCFFEDISDIVFNCTIVCHRLECITFHRYKCIRME